jgi:hypothetical protein
VPCYISRFGSASRALDRFDECQLYPLKVKNYSEFDAFKQRHLIIEI